jgi:hypothetical protein
VHRRHLVPAIAQDFGLDRKQISLDGDDPTQPPQQGCEAQHEFVFDRRLGVV